MAAEAEAAREARAKVFGAFICFHEIYVMLYAMSYIMTYVICQVIAAQGEQKASKSLAEASQVMAQSSAALQLRYLQVRDMLCQVFGCACIPILTCSWPPSRLPAHLPVPVSFM
jgi:hypothetical protein